MTTWQADGVFVKVCGLDTPENVEAAVEAGADAIGFVHWEPSVRHRELDEIRRLAALAEVPTVLVTVDQSSAALLEAAARAGVDAVQPHGRDALIAGAAARRAGLGVIFPIKAGEQTPPNDELLLVDTPHGGPEGGTGETFDWDLAASLDRPFLLAGGLDTDNVADAVRKLRPFGVDASSGLESSPGVKDAELIRRFVAAAKGA